MDDATTKIHQSNENISGKGFCLVRIYDTKSGKNTIVNVKVQGQELVMILDESNEEDFTTQFKVKRATKEFAKCVADRLRIVQADGGGEEELKLEIDWTGIKRIQIEAKNRQEKLERIRKEDEERKKARELKEATEKAEAERRRIQEESERREKERMKKEAEEKKKKLDEERRYKALTDKISGAMLDGGGIMDINKLKQKRSGGTGDAGNEPDEQGMSNLSTNVSKAWSEEHQDFYFYDEDKNELTWRHPAIKSDWEKLWSDEKKAFYYVNEKTGQSVWEAPWETRYKRVLNDDGEGYTYYHIETGEQQSDEPYY